MFHLAQNVSVSSCSCAKPAVFHKVTHCCRTALWEGNGPILHAYSQMFHFTLIVCVYRAALHLCLFLIRYNEFVLLRGTGFCQPTKWAFEIRLPSGVVCLTCCLCGCDVIYLVSTITAYHATSKQHHSVQ